MSDREKQAHAHAGMEDAERPQWSNAEYLAAVEAETMRGELR